MTMTVLPAGDLLALLEHHDYDNRIALSVRRCAAVAVTDLDDERERAMWFVDGYGWFSTRSGSANETRLVALAAPADIEQVVVNHAEGLGLRLGETEGLTPWISPDRFDSIYLRQAELSLGRGGT